MGNKHAKESAPSNEVPKAPSSKPTPGLQGKNVVAVKSGGISFPVSCTFFLIIIIIIIFCLFVCLFDFYPFAFSHVEKITFLCCIIFW